MVWVLVSEHVVVVGVGSAWVAVWSSVESVVVGEKREFVEAVVDGND